MPKLRVLDLKEIWIAPELLRFLEAHAGTLEIVRSVECLSGVDEESVSGTWSELFTTLSRLKPNNLKSVEVLPLLDFTEFQGRSDKIERERAVTELREVKGRRGFWYGREDRGHRCACEYEEMSLVAF
jgi:hypothetical protein